MALIFNITDDKASMLAGACCAFGVFDGVHQGHRYLIDQALHQARARASASVIVTFDIDPDELFAAATLRKILSNAQRIEALAACGVDAVCVMPFNRQIAAMQPHAFLDQAFAGHVPALIEVGSDLRFGVRASGTVDDLARWGAGRGMQVAASQLLEQGGSPITATRIRGLLGQGKVEQANQLLGYPYTLREVVRAGRGEGTDMGFSTANLEVPVHRQVLAEGVYGAYAIVDGQRYRAAVSVGVSPVFRSSATATCEVHILDFERDIYGREIDVQFVEWLRPMIAFDSIEELIATVKANIAHVRTSLEL